MICPLCEKEMEQLWPGEEVRPEQKGYHHWCEPCNHGWRITTLKNIAIHNLGYGRTGNKKYKSPEQIKEIIKKEDAERNVETRQLA